jgi:membrane complex biogenesis BtpA family protein
MGMRSSGVRKKDGLEGLFGVRKPIIGMIHLLPLPGSPSYRGNFSGVISACEEDARSLDDGGVDGIMIENMHDIPFAKAIDVGFETVTSMTAAAMTVKQISKKPIGFNVLANAVPQAIAVAVATGGKYVRGNEWANAYVADEGITEAAAPAALRYRARVRGDEVRVFADVYVKHGSHFIIHDRSIEEQTKDVEFFEADAIIVSGTRTGEEPDLDILRKVKGATALPVLIGSGLSVANARKLLSIADGAIVGSSLKKGGYWKNGVDQKRVEQLMRAVKTMR